MVLRAVPTAPLSSATGRLKLFWGQRSPFARLPARDHGHGRCGGTHGRRQYLCGVGPGVHRQRNPPLPAIWAVLLLGALLRVILLGCADAAALPD